MSEALQSFYDKYKVIDSTVNQQTDDMLSSDPSVSDVNAFRNKYSVNKRKEELEEDTFARDHVVAKL